MVTHPESMPRVDRSDEMAEDDLQFALLAYEMGLAEDGKPRDTSGDKYAYAPYLFRELSQGM